MQRILRRKGRKTRYALYVNCAVLNLLQRAAPISSISATPTTAALRCQICPPPLSLRRAPHRPPIATHARSRCRSSRAQRVATRQTTSRSRKSAPRHSRRRSRQRLARTSSDASYTHACRPLVYTRARAASVKQLSAAGHALFQRESSARSLLCPPSASRARPRRVSEPPPARAVLSAERFA